MTQPLKLRTADFWLAGAKAAAEATREARMESFILCYVSEKEKCVLEWICDIPKNTSRFSENGHNRASPNRSCCDISRLQPKFLSNKFPMAIHDKFVAKRMVSSLAGLRIASRVCHCNAPYANVTIGGFEARPKSKGDRTPLDVSFLSLSTAPRSM